MKQKPKRKRSIILRLLVLGVSVYMVVNLISRGNELAKEKEELKRLEAKRDFEKMQVEELEALLNADSFDAVIEKAARERLGYVYSDEIIYIDISDN